MQRKGRHRLGGCNLNLNLYLSLGSGKAGEGEEEEEEIMSFEALYTPFLVAASQTTLTLKAFTKIKLINFTSGTWRDWIWTDDQTITVAEVLDTGSIEAGRDYYLYLCSGGVFKVSLNSTYPNGYNADTSRKIGGFHTLCTAAGTISGHPLSGYAAGAILPASVWCLNYRPISEPAGMVYCEEARIWVDIYLQSGTTTSTASSYGGTITKSRLWDRHVDMDLAVVKKRLLWDHEFSLIAKGSNTKTNISGSSDPVTTGGHVDTAGWRMISNIGCEDCCGVYWQWINDGNFRYDANFPSSYNKINQPYTITHAPTPGGNPIYVKITNDGTPYLCCNMSDGNDKVLSFGGAGYKVIIKHDASASSGLQLYFAYNAGQPYRLLVNNTILGKDMYALCNDVNYFLILKHDSSASSNGRAVNYDVTDSRLEYISPGSVNSDIDLAKINDPYWGYHDLYDNFGSMNRQGEDGQSIKLLAGNCFNGGANCGPRSRNADFTRWNGASSIGARGCAEPKNT